MNFNKSKEKFYFELYKIFRNKIQVKGSMKLKCIQIFFLFSCNLKLYTHQIQLKFSQHNKSDWPYSFFLSCSQFQTLTKFRHFATISPNYNLINQS